MPLKETNRSRMSLLSPPQIPLFRITLFYGPEAVEGASDSVRCVFNVKKRSWKGGVQVEVVMKRNQIDRLEEILQHSSWLEVVLKGVPVENRGGYREKAMIYWCSCCAFTSFMPLFSRESSRKISKFQGTRSLLRLMRSLSGRPRKLKGRFLSSWIWLKPKRDPRHYESTKFAIIPHFVFKNRRLMNHSGLKYQ